MSRQLDAQPAIVKHGVRTDWSPRMDDIAMKPPEPMLAPGRRRAVAPDRQPPAAGYWRRHLSARRPAADRGGTVAAVPRQSPHRPPRAGGTVARRPGAGGAGPRLVRRRGRAGLHGGAAHAIFRMDPPAQQGAIRARIAAQGDRRRTAGRRRARHPAGSRVVLLERLGFADDRPVSLAQHYFPATGCAG